MKVEANLLQAVSYFALSISKGASPLALCRDLLIFLAFFLLVSQGVQRLVPWPGGSEIESKFRHFEEHKDEYDLVFFGSSITYRSFIPNLLQDELSRSGIDIRSFNFGGPGMRSFEQDHLIRRTLDTAPERLSIAVVELRDWNPSFSEKNAFTKRMVHWHSTRSLGQIISSLRKWPPTKTAPSDTFLYHLRHWLWKMTNFGAGPDIIASALRGTSHSDIEVKMLSQHGYLALEDETGELYLERKREILDDPAEYKRRVTRLTQRQGRSAPTHQFNEDAIRDQVALFSNAGIQAIYVVPPSTKNPPMAQPLLDKGVVENLLTYDHPTRFPRYYAPESHFDFNHLTKEMAQNFTQRFAKDLLPFLLNETGE